MVVAVAMVAVSCASDAEAPEPTAVAGDGLAAAPATAGDAAPTPSERATATPPTGLAEAGARTGLIQLRDPLDEPRSRALCIDVPGFGAGLRLDAPMQLHTCKGGTDDETFVADQPSPGQVHLVAFDRCLAAAPVPGSAVLVEPCRDVAEQLFVYSEQGHLHPAQAPELCVSAASGRSQSAGGPEYVRRDLLLQRCDEVDSSLVSWRVPGERLGP